LARRVAHDPTLPHISTSTVGRWLNAERLRPWRYHTWQHIHDPISFLQRALPVLHAYGHAQALLHAGIWLLSSTFSENGHVNRQLELPTHLLLRTLQQNSER
jgi:hypothetical protein